MEEKEKNKEIENLYYSKKYKWVHRWVLRFFGYDEHIHITEELVEEIDAKRENIFNSAQLFFDYVRTSDAYQASMDEFNEISKAKGYEDGFAQEYAAARAKGERESQLEVSENMLRYGYSAELIHKCTKLPMEEIRKLAKKIGVELVE